MAFQESPRALVVGRFHAVEGQLHVRNKKILLDYSPYLIDAEDCDGGTNRHGQHERDCCKTCGRERWFASCPAPHLLSSADGPCLDRFVEEEAVQFVGQCLRG